MRSVLEGLLAFVVFLAVIVAVGLWIIERLEAGS